MIAYIITEGPFDTQLLQLLIPENLLDKVGIVTADGVSNAISLARSLVVRRQVPVALMIDADSIAPELIQERCQSIEEVVQSVAGNILVKVVAAIPEMEIIFFQDASLLSRIFGFELSEDFLTSANLQPRKALEQLFSRSKTIYNRTDFITTLEDNDIEILRKSCVIQELIQFLQMVYETAEASQKV